MSIYGRLLSAYELPMTQDEIAMMDGGLCVRSGIKALIIYGSSHLGSHVHVP